MHLGNKTINKYYFTLTLKIFLNWETIFLRCTTIEHDFKIKVGRNK